MRSHYTVTYSSHAAVDYRSRVESNETAVGEIAAPGLRRHPGARGERAMAFEYRQDAPGAIDEEEGAGDPKIQKPFSLLPDRFGGGMHPDGK